LSHIDYISASYSVIFDTVEALLQKDGLSAFTGIVPYALLSGMTIKKAKHISRPGYREGMQFPSGFSVFFGGQDTLLIEISGRGCNACDIISHMATVHRGRAGHFRFIRFTRIDIAKDYETNESPFDAVSKLGINARIKSRNVNNSKTGQTFYVGSRRSDRFLRVYRYWPPHPRSDYLRFEYQYNKGIADKIASQLLDDGHSPDSIYNASMRKTFDNAPDYHTPSADVSRNHERSKSSTLNWIYTQVAPALATLLDEGEIDWASLAEYVEEIRRQ